MSFLKKLWKNRESQYPSRRTMTRVDTGTSVTYEVERAEGTVTEVGDDFSAESMNDLEDRIADAFEATPSYNIMSKSELTTGTATTSRVVRADYLKSAILALANPVGTIIESTTCDTMAKVVAAYGGTTWIQHTGYVLRGASSSVTANQASNDGGADSVTVSSVASHNHTQNAHGHTWTCAFTRKSTNNEAGNFPLNAIGTPSTTPVTVNNQTATNIANGANYTINTLPKYKNVYIWERTA